MKPVRRNGTMGSESGVALIAAVMAVAVLLAIGLSFSFNMRLEEKASVNYMNSIKAQYLAEAGVARAVATLQEQANDDDYLDANFSILKQNWAGGMSIGLGNGNFNIRYTRTVAGTGDEVYTFLDETAGDDVNGHIIRGVIDEERKININTANRDLLRNLLGDGNYTRADDIIDERDGANAGSPSDDTPFRTITQIMNVSGIGVGTFYGDDINNNHKLDTGEVGGTAGVLDGGIEDLITVISDSGNYLVDPGSSNPGPPPPSVGGYTWPVNVNTAPKTVLVAVLTGIGGAIDATEAGAIADAIIEYRDGADDIEGTSDDNPFDGWDTDGPSGATDTVDIDPDLGAAVAAADRYIFAGGARGELNAFIDALTSPALTDNERRYIKDNADPSAGVDYNGDGNADNNCWTTSFCFKSKYFQIISEGTVRDPAGNVAASCKIERIVGPIQDEDDIVD